MRRCARTGLPAVAASAAAAALCLGASAATTASTASPAAAGPGSQLWVSSYNGPNHSFDVATATVASPDGRVVFVTGRSAGAKNTDDYATVAITRRPGRGCGSAGTPHPAGVSMHRSRSGSARTAAPCT